MGVRCRMKATPKRPRAENDKSAEKKSSKERVDSLGVTRGQNAEKGNTIKKEHIRDEGLVSH